MVSTADLVTVAGHNVQVNAGGDAAPNPQAQAIHNYLVSQGMTPEAAQGVVSNMTATAASPAAATAAPSPTASQATGGGDPYMLGTDALAALIGGHATSIAGAGGAPALTLPGMGLGGGPPGTNLGSVSAARDWLATHGGYSGANPDAAPVAGGAGTAATSPLNVPYGSAYYQPYMTLLGQILGFANGDRQDNIKTLAGLQANPHSASELAFMRAGLGMDPFSTTGGNALDVSRLIGSTTSGGSVPGTAGFGNGQTVTVPGTLSGAQLADLKGMPNTQGVIESMANTAGNPDLVARSVKALMPALFGQGALGYGTTVGFGAGTGI